MCPNFPLLPRRTRTSPPRQTRCLPLPRQTTRAIAPRLSLPPGPTRCRYRVTTFRHHTTAFTLASHLRQYQRTRRRAFIDTKHTSPKKISSSHQHAVPVKSNTVYAFARPCVWQDLSPPTISPFHLLFVPPMVSSGHNHKCQHG